MIRAEVVDLLRAAFAAGAHMGGDTSPSDDDHEEIENSIRIYAEKWIASHLPRGAVGATVCELFAAGIAHSKGSWRHVGKGRMVSDNPKAKGWEATIAWYAKLAMRGAALTDKRVRVVIMCNLPRPPNRTKKFRRDIDKLARCCLDALTGIVYRDDEQVDELEIEKRIVGATAQLGVGVQVYELSDPA